MFCEAFGLILNHVEPSKACYLSSRLVIKLTGVSEGSLYSGLV